MTTEWAPTSNLMALHGPRLRERREGSIIFPRAIFVNYSAVEWFEFERDFAAMAQSLGLEIQVEVSSSTYRTVISWSPVKGQS